MTELPTLLPDMRPVFTRQDTGAVALVPPPKADNVLARPHLDYNVRTGLWEVASDYHLKDGIYTLTVPKGFTLNLASIPRPLWVVLASYELGLVGPLIHDLLYFYQGRVGGLIQPYKVYSRKEADKLFLRVMTAEGVGYAKRMIAYRAVRTFGTSAWKNRG